MTRSMWGGLTALAVVCAPVVARGQAILHEDDPLAEAPADEASGQRERYRSPQSWALELRFGPYRPDVDTEFSGTPGPGPHERFFGTKPRLMVQGELDYQFFQAFGTAAVGLSLGYFRETAGAFVEGPAGLGGERSGDTTSLMLVPAALTFVYRMDLAARRWKVPLVPYAKVGLNYTFWRITDGNGSVARSEAPGGKGRGGTPGWQGAVGVALLLDIIDMGAARALDGETGINHTYLFLEGARFAASGLGREDVLRVGDTTWLAGLLFEF